MRANVIVFVMIALFAPVAFGQTPAEPSVDRTFYFTQTKTPQEFQEAATAIRSITNIREMSADADLRSLALHGSADQIAIAQWLYNELDQSGSTSHEYRVPGTGDDVLRVTYFTRARTPQELVEAVTLVRSLANIRLVFIYIARDAVVMRATAAQIALANWLFTELEKHDPASPGQHSASPVYQATDGPHDYNTVRVVYMAHAATDQDFVEAVTLARSISDMPQVFTHNALRAVAMRGTAGEVALAEWLLNQIDKPAKEQAAAEYDVPENRDDVVRVFYLANAGTPQDLAKFATQIRTEVKVPRLFVYNAPKAIAVRGTAEQVALAEQLSRQ